MELCSECIRDIECDGGPFCGCSCHDGGLSKKGNQMSKLSEQVKSVFKILSNEVEELRKTLEQQEIDLENVKNIRTQLERELLECHNMISALKGGKYPGDLSDVLQPWVRRLTFMQQSVLMSAVRGPDTLHKHHISKDLLRWYRRCIFYSAFEKKVFLDPWEKGGGSFTGPCSYTNMVHVIEEYMRSLDEIPHHFHMHLVHAAEIIAYKHSYDSIREFWYKFYCRAVNDLHLYTEPENVMDKRLGDDPVQWQDSEGKLDESRRYGNPILDYREDGNS